MESNIKGLVAAGHEMASELKAECGAVDMRSVAKLISDLATQLEVQLVRANALAAENAGLKQSEKEFNNFCRQEYYGWEDNFTETPATDAFWLKLNAKQSASSLTALNTSCVTSCLRMTPKRCLRLCVFSGRTGR